MTKFHISKSGKPAECKAKNGNCPLGGENEHYPSKVEAQKAIEEKLFQQNNTLISQKSKKIKTEELVSSLSSALLNNSWDNSQEVSKIIDNVYDNLDNYGAGSEYWDSISEQIENAVQKELLQSSDITESLKTVQNNIENNGNIELLKDNINKYENFSFTETDLENLTDVLTQDYKNLLKSNDESTKELAYQARMLRDMVSAIEEAEYDDYINVNTCKDLGNGLYYVCISDDGEKTHYLYYDQDDYLHTGNGKPSNLRIQWYSDDEFNMIEKELYMSGLNEKEKDAILKQGMLNNLAIDDTNKESVIEKVKNMPTGENKKIINEREINALGVSQSILSKNTFLHSQIGDNDIEFTGNTNRQKADFFRSGIVKLNPKSDKYKTYEKKAQKAISESNSDNDNVLVKDMLRNSNYPDIQPRAIQDDKVKEKFDKIKEKDPECFDIIREYSGDGYANYVYTAYGYDKSIYDSKHGKDIKDIKKANEVLKNFHQGEKTQKRNLYRSQRTPRGMSAQEYLDNLNVGDITITNKITSTSTNYGETDSFGVSNTKYKGSENVRFVYHSNKGVYISPISQVEEENEVLLPIGEKMVVTDKFINTDGQAYVFFSDID